MNKDVLECKKRALETLSSENESNQNGRKKGYVKLMTEQWIGMGYGHLSLTVQNLRDQAARLEKIRDSASNSVTISEEIEVGSEINRVEYAASQASPITNLHTANSRHVPMGPNECPENNNNNSISDPGCLPKYFCNSRPSTIFWGQRKDGNTIYIT